MKKTDMIATIAAQTAYAWYKLAEAKYEYAQNLEEHCGYKFFCDAISDNVVYNRALGAWSDLDTLCKSLGIDYDDNDYCNKASELATKTFQRVKEG